MLKPGEKHIINAEIASKVWNELSESEKSKLRKYFHLRPTSIGISIISTLPIAPMRGIHTTKNNIEGKLKAILDNYETLTSVDEEKVLKISESLGFKKRATEENKLEESIQALMINTMRDSNIHEILHSDRHIEFVASELIFEKGKNRIDIVGWDRQILYFFELKKDRTTKVEQVANYVAYYSDDKNRQTLKELLNVYPINPVTEYNEIKGVMVMRFAENTLSSENWKNMAQEKNINILFYKQSLSFLK